VKPGDLVRVKVVGLAAYMRKFHDDPAIIVATHSVKGRPLALWQILWGGKIMHMEPNLLHPIDEETKG
jgi:hypothetical protein